MQQIIKNHLPKKSFEYVIVGAGSAGCVLAHRLVMQNKRVALIETGPKDDSKLISTPIGVGLLLPRLIPMTKKFSWGYEGEPENHLKGKKIFSPRYYD